MLTRLRGRHYHTGQPIEIHCAEGRIVAVEPLANVPPDAGWIAPAFFDLQINGCLGKAFVSPDLSEDDVHVVAAECQRHGMAGLCPTLITGGHAALAHGFTTLRRACESSPSLARVLPCFHLEGPYISPDDGPRGAHPREHVRPPDLDEFHRWQDCAGGRIRLVTLAPEHETALPFIEALVREGVVVALGHTAASPRRIREAIAAGARLSTHLGNGSHAVLPRHDNYLWEQLASDELTASFIPDGHHLPRAVLRCLVRVKTPARLIITCDASSLAGMPPGRYSMWGQELEVHAGGKVTVPGTTFLAGSGVLTDACARTLLEQGDVTLSEVITMACHNPRTLLGLPPIDLVVGAPADLIEVECQPFRLRQTVVAGSVVE
ncbi:MAG: N-acetylglucosamine-6-phosphate deacetylase [Gemmataceae bacterium]